MRATRSGDVGPDLTRDLEGGPVVGALEGDVLAGADLVDDVAVLLLKATELLDELVLVEIELELGLDLVVEEGGVLMAGASGDTGAAALGGEFEEALEELDLVLVGPEALEELTGVRRSGLDPERDRGGDNSHWRGRGRGRDGGNRERIGGTVES